MRWSCWSGAGSWVGLVVEALWVVGFVVWSIDGGTMVAWSIDGGSGVWCGGIYSGGVEERKI